LTEKATSDLAPSVPQQKDLLKLLEIHPGRDQLQTLLKSGELHKQDLIHEIITRAIPNGAEQAKEVARSIYRDGKTIKEAALWLGITEPTVRSHLNHIREYWRIYIKHKVP
jgi:DNA-directed RNA polymerase specialized sigma24 family protein